MSVSGQVTWPPESPVWSFNWQMLDGDTEGLVFRNAFFKGRKVLHKGSLPMILVRYDHGAGPFKDQLSTGNAPNPVLVHEGSGSGFRFIAVECYHRISAYRIIERWIFWNDGLIQPRLLSRGIFYPSSHQHNVYWRLDFDVDGVANNLALQHTYVATDWGYGKGWKPLTIEQDTDGVGDGTYAVLNKQTNRGYKLVSGPSDGAPDYISPHSFAVVRFRADEDLKGRLGTPHDPELWKHINHENVDGQDVVAWYIAHLKHSGSDSGDEYHACGPDLWPIRY
ncbi:hypothetical protein [Nocardia aurantia]|uniref:Uncharacterized protein n=1 Tax=Nocardia aurantia TaxID=2585199 RepID=A0A7K0DNI8_9NOCA|nr:hypothetical protein [Nocardia aurantia]MQY27303.1 hypothetical protein [Nocardia aurantia]